MDPLLAPQLFELNYDLYFDLFLAYQIFLSDLVSNVKRHPRQPISSLFLCKDRCKNYIGQICPYISFIPLSAGPYASR